jgi:hypothetical protein
MKFKMILVFSFLILTIGVFANDTTKISYEGKIYDGILTEIENEKGEKVNVAIIKTAEGDNVAVTVGVATTTCGAYLAGKGVILLGGLITEGSGAAALMAGLKVLGAGSAVLGVGVVSGGVVLLGAGAYYATYYFRQGLRKRKYIKNMNKQKIHITQ